MLEDLKKLIKKIESSEKYKGWKKNNSKAFLVNIFTMFSDTEDINLIWQLHYYNSETQKIASFTKHDKEITLKKDQDFVKQTEIKELDINEVKEEPDSLIKKIKAKYHNEKINKIIVILQNSGEIIWNVTLLTGSFNVIHVKANAITGEFITDEVKSAMSFKL